MLQLTPTGCGNLPPAGMLDFLPAPSAFASTNQAVPHAAATLPQPATPGKLISARARANRPRGLDGVDGFSWGGGTVWLAATHYLFGHARSLSQA